MVKLTAEDEGHAFFQPKTTTIWNGLRALQIFFQRHNISPIKAA